MKEKKFNYNAARKFLVQKTAARKDENLALWERARLDFQKIIDIKVLKSEIGKILKLLEQNYVSPEKI